MWQGIYSSTIRKPSGCCIISRRILDCRRLLPGADGQDGDLSFIGYFDARITRRTAGFVVAPGELYCQRRGDQHSSLILLPARLVILIPASITGYPGGRMNRLKKFMEIKSPSTSFAITDADQQNSFPGGLYFSLIPVNKVHGDVRNQLFFDWHVEGVK